MRTVNMCGKPRLSGGKNRLYIWLLCYLNIVPSLKEAPSLVKLIPLLMNRIKRLERNSKTSCMNQIIKVSFQSKDFTYYCWMLSARQINMDNVELNKKKKELYFWILS